MAQAYFSWTYFVTFRGRLIAQRVVDVASPAANVRRAKYVPIIFACQKHRPCTRKIITFRMRCDNACVYGKVCTLARDCVTGCTMQQVAKKCPARQKAISRQPSEIFHQNFRIYSRRGLQQSLKSSSKYFHCFKNYSSYYFIPYFKITPKKWTVVCNVQCSTS